VSVRKLRQYLDDTTHPLPHYRIGGKMVVRRSDRRGGARPRARKPDGARQDTGFNASHSMGAMLFVLVFGFLALAHGQLLFQSPFLLVVGLAMLGGFVSF
jgi:hypothetical protein